MHRPRLAVRARARAATGFLSAFREWLRTPTPHSTLRYRTPAIGTRDTASASSRHLPPLHATAVRTSVATTCRGVEAFLFRAESCRTSIRSNAELRRDRNRLPPTA